jgi:putative tricarboxylic transport membrane protein
MPVRRGELAMALLVLGVGALSLYGSLQHRYYTEFGPDAGFFPFWLGLVETVLGAALVFAVWTGRTTLAEPRPVGTRRQILAAVLFIFYVACLDFAGFALATFVFLVVVVGWVERRSWLEAGAYGAGLTAGLVWLFQWAFRLPLPAGVLKF